MLGTIFCITALIGEVTVICTTPLWLPPVAKASGEEPKKIEGVEDTPIQTKSKWFYEPSVTLEDLFDEINKEVNKK